MPILATQYPVYQPAMRVISSITSGSPAVVTTTFPHQYDTGMIVRLNIPPGFGMQQANQLTSKIIVTGNTTFKVDFSTELFDPFTTPASFPLNRQYAQVTPVGEINSQLKDATRNVLPY